MRPEESPKPAFDINNALMTGLRRAKRRPSAVSAIGRTGLATPRRETCGGRQKDLSLPRAGIGGTIREINNISTAIAAAVEEQGVATQQIASNIREASHVTDAVSRNVGEVMMTSSQTGSAASQMTAAASELSRQAETLRSEVDGFIHKIRHG